MVESGRGGYRKWLRLAGLAGTYINSQFNSVHPFMPDWKLPCVTTFRTGAKNTTERKMQRSYIVKGGSLSPPGRNSGISGSLFQSRALFSPHLIDRTEPRQ